MKKILPLLLLLTACATIQSGHSGFLDDYSILQPDPDVPDTVLWESPNAEAYDHFIVAPIVAYFHPNVAGKPIDAGDLDNLLTRLRGFLIDALTEDALLTTRPGPGVMRVEVAVTNLHARASAAGLGLGSATVELRATDSETGALLFAEVFQPKVAEGAGSGDWTLARATARRWAARLKQGLDVARVD